MRELAKKIQEITDMMIAEEMTSATQKHHVTSMAMATAVAYSLALPTGAVHSSKSWYMTNAFPAASEVVGRLNESFIPVDVANVMTIIRNVWTLRYNVLHVPNSHAAMKGEQKTNAGQWLDCLPFLTPIVEVDFVARASLHNHPQLLRAREFRGRGY